MVLENRLILNDINREGDVCVILCGRGYALISNSTASGKTITFKD